MRVELHEKIWDEWLKTSVLAARVENTLTTFKISIIGSDPHTTQQYDPHGVLQSITDKWIGLDGKCFGSLAVIFSAEGLPIYVAFYEESKFINGHYQAV